jgi:predicted PurR-regulated permease PerM
MKKHTSRERWRSLGIFGLGALLALSVFYMLRLNFGAEISAVLSSLNTVLLPASIALFLYYLIRPTYDRLLRLTKSRSKAAMRSVFIALGGILALLGTVAALVYTQLVVLDWPELLADTEVFILGLNLPWIPENFSVMETIREAAAQLEFANIFTSALVALIAFSEWFIVMILFPTFLYFFLKEGDRMFDALIDLLPRKLFKDEVEKVFRLANESTSNYMRGKIISIGFLMAYFFVAFTVAFVLFGIGFWSAVMYGLLFAIIISILDLIPLIGPTVGIVLPMTFFVIQSPNLSEDIVRVAIYAGSVLVVNFVGQDLQKIFIEPVIMSREVKVHPLLVLSGLFFFGGIFGFAGFILATPIVATIQNSIYYFRKSRAEEETAEVAPEQKEKE